MSNENWAPTTKEQLTALTAVVRDVERAFVEHLRAASRAEREEQREIARAIRTMRAEQRAIERDRVAVKRRGAPLQSSGGMTYPGRPRR